MSIQLSVAVRNAKLDAIETTIGTAPKLVFLTGSAPANCAAAETGTRLAVMTLPSDWMANASAGVKVKSGTWEDPSADAAGTAGYYRIYDSAGTTCHEQGSITSTLVGTGDMLLDNVVLAIGQDVIVTAFQHTEGNA